MSKETKGTVKKKDLAARVYQLELENEKLTAALEEAEKRAEYARKRSEENQRNCELRYNAGIIHGLKYALTTAFGAKEGKQA